jgi:hypothetical protein
MTKSSFIGDTTAMNKTGIFNESMMGFKEEMQDIVADDEFMKHTDSSKQKVNMAMMNTKTRSTAF